MCLAVLLCSHAEYVSHFSFGLTPFLKKNILDLFKFGSTAQAAANVFSPFQNSLIIRRTVVLPARQMFWDWYNGWPFQYEPSSGRAVLTTAVSNVKKLRYQLNIHMYTLQLGLWLPWKSLFVKCHAANHGR